MKYIICLMLISLTGCVSSQHEVNKLKLEQEIEILTLQKRKLIIEKTIEKIEKVDLESLYDK